ncbi:hypothetical protein [Flavobacterium sp.]|jgi:hypothetical protein|uniref:hypothetical protein n=1 Tax=Flavobacterium sp. TaxID=239 RepID=UPI003784BDA2
MKKVARYLILIYIFSLFLSFVGYWLDSDVPQNTLAYQMFEVFMLSIFLFGLLSGLFCILYLMFSFFKSLMQKENQYSK